MTAVSARAVGPADLRQRPGVAVRLEGLTRRYGSVLALDGLDLDIAGGEFVALLGPSGCGKTTALRAIAGFDRPDGGRVLVDGRDVTDVPANKRDMGMVFQAYSLFPNLTVAENVAFGLRVRGRDKGERRGRATELLELVGLADRAQRYPHQLSGGQQQRVALARALAVAPQVLLLDEPLSALDAQVRVQLREEIRRIQLELGITTVFVTHDQAEALSVADRVGVLRAGRLEQVASINASGHKYGLVYPGVGWLIFRDASKLPEDLVFSVNYLGGAQPTFTFNFSRGSAMIQAQMYNFLRLGRSGYTSIVETMLANARFLNESLEASGKFEILNPGLAEPVVTFAIKGDPGFDVYHLSARLREDGWIVPAYSLPPDAEEVHLMRVVVRLDLSHMMIEQLLRDLMIAWDALVAEQPVQRPSAKPDVWTSPAHAAAKSKARTGLVK